ncbi:MAG: nucleotidyl transferase AbiEii/AbiGii toxin family protein [bacterium]|nr:nucleotidyl transferase AbiEii/AbiGii toxin family protein [bacterium]
MITAEIIQTLAKKYQTEAINVWREYFQHLFLAYFYKQPEAGDVYFKGGTALRLIYQSPRFSEDLDFSSRIKDIKKIEHAVINALTEIEREGIGTELTDATETTGGYLATMQFRNNGERIATRIEISLRNGKKEKGELVTIAGDFIPPYTLVQLVQEQIVEGKIAALLSRKKPRDFYDFYFLLRANMIPVKSKELLRGTLDALQASHIRFDSELKRFLPQSHWPMIRNFKATLEREIRKYL